MTNRGLTRREWSAGLAAAAGAGQALGQSGKGGDLGSLYPPVQAIADASQRELSYLRPEFKDLPEWQKRARGKLFELLQYQPPQAAPEVQVISRRQREGYTEEQITFKTTPWFRVPAHVLIPNGAKQPRPGIVLLHDHGGFYMWGREKVIATDNEHPALKKFKERAYHGRSIGTELVRQGYVVISIDMFYWGERRRLLPEDPAMWRERSAEMTEQQVNEFNQRASLNEQLTARSLITAGATWPGVMLWDDIRTLDYLASRPEVDAKRLGCVGLSVGGYRSFMLAALDPRIKVGVDVCWMTTFAAQVERHVIHTMGLAFIVPGMYRYFDMPEFSAAVAPRALMVIMGAKDFLFPLPAMKESASRIEQCYRKAGVPERQLCRIYDAPHEFNPQMQADAWNWLSRWI